MHSTTFHSARLHGSAMVPPAKSEAHRALLLAALGQGQCRLNGFPPPLCDDTLAMMNGITALGATVTPKENALLVAPVSPKAGDAPAVTCMVNACAAALRMLIPAFLARGQAVRFTMHPALFARPMDAFDPLIAKIGGNIKRTPAGDDGLASIEISGTMHAGQYEIDGSKSSQFASGMLIALAHATDEHGNPAPSTLTVTKPIVSRPYLDMTLGLMKRFGIQCDECEEGVFTLSPATAKNPETLDVTGDWSQAAVLLCANAMGSGVMLEHMCTDGASCLQGDARILDVLCQMGLRLYQTRGELYAVSPSHAGLMPLDIDCTDIPDVAPILALTCTQARGLSTLRGVSRLRLKECDRLDATAKLLTQLGAEVSVLEDGDTLTVRGPVRLTGGFSADARGDHRMVMLLAVAALICDKPITVTGVESINKSWPGFLDTWQKLGGVVS